MCLGCPRVEGLHVTGPELDCVIPVHMDWPRDPYGIDLHLLAQVDQYPLRMQRIVLAVKALVRYGLLFQ